MKLSYRAKMLSAVAAVLLILPGCKSSQDMVNQASGLMGLAGGIPEISQFMSLAQLGGLGDMLGGGSPFTLLAPSNNALEALGKNTIDRLKSPAGADELKGLLERHVVPGSQSAEDLSSRLGGANILKSESNDSGVVHVIDSVLPEG